ncbi:hypothetical protein niasHT_032940 [Heterodera trifolii]|uniref:Uncharacterized protein n=1 Tax=Heterodera trifolii TaxID=157864 RepID=A0ABD2IS19_9BILA
MCQRCSKAGLCGITGIWRRALKPSKRLLPMLHLPSILSLSFIRFPSPFADSVMPFVLTNELIREQLTLKKMNDIDRVLLIRSPIVRDESKWAKWEEEAIGWNFMDQWNRIDI